MSAMFEEVAIPPSSMSIAESRKRKIENPDEAVLIAFFKEIV